MEKLRLATDIVRYRAAVRAWLPSEIESPYG